MNSDSAVQLVGVMGPFRTPRFHFRSPHPDRPSVLPVRYNDNTPTSTSTQNTNKNLTEIQISILENVENVQTQDNKHRFADSASHVSSATIDTLGNSALARSL